MLQNTYWDKCQPVAEKIAMQLHNISIYFESMTLGVEATIGAVNFPQDDARYDEILDRSERIPATGGADVNTNVAG